MPKLFEDLRETLLAAGIAPRHVRRYLAELKDHLADLRNETGGEAAALARLGTVGELAQPMLARPELRSLAARYPRTLYGVAPAAFWLGLTIATLMLVVPLEKHGIMFRPGGDAAWVSPLVQGMMLVYFRILPVVLAVVAMIFAIRQRSSLVSPGIGAGVSLVMAYTLTFSYTAAIGPGERSELQITSWLVPFLAPFTDSLGRMNVHALLPGLLQAMAIFVVIMAAALAGRRWTWRPAQA